MARWIGTFLAELRAAVVPQRGPHPGRPAGSPQVVLGARWLARAGYPGGRPLLAKAGSAKLHSRP